MSDYTPHHGDCLEVMAGMEAGSVNCCVTSPPYWGLRDYGVDGQLGLEPTPEEYVAKLVAVFREVHRVLRDDGTLWLVLGDSYAGSGKGAWDVTDVQKEVYVPKPGGLESQVPKVPAGLKPKDLVGIPWLVAKALQAPLYTGRIASEADRAWLAGFLDGEGTISFVERNRGEGHTNTHDVRVFVTNCDAEPLRYFADLTAGQVYNHERGDRENRYGSRPCYRWQMGTHDGALLLRELYPYLRTKRKQAALVWTLYATLRHKNGHARTPDGITAKRQSIAEMVRTLNAGGDVDLPAWVEEPPSATEPGWWLRSDIIWSKPNPMPESVTDRPTKAHEYVFLLTKSERYYYDSDAIRVAHAAVSLKRIEYGLTHRHPDGIGVGIPPVDTDRMGERFCHKNGRNKRDVWHIATQPYPEAHFATYPEKLVEPCVLAGCPEGGTVLDPFTGSGTTGVVAYRLGRKFIGIELNPEYAAMAERRIAPWRDQLQMEMDKD